MARRRRSSILDAIDAFNAAYDTTTRVAKDIELSKVANANFEESQVYTQDQGDQLRAAAESGQYDIGIKTKEDGTFDSYTVTPKADPSQTGTVAMQGVTDFLGTRTAGRMSQDQRDRARLMAMAGVLEKYDPQEGMRLRREVKTQERDDQRWDRQTKQWEREDRDQAKRDEYEAGRRALFGQTRFGQNQAQYQQAMADYQQRMAEWQQNPQGPQPVAPSRPEYTIGDSLADRAMLIDHDAKYGRLDARTFGEFVDLMQRVQDEGYERTLRLAQSGAPGQEVIKAFNGTGKVRADPANIVSDKMVKRPDGVTTRVIQYKDAQGNVRTLDTVAELDALGKASEVFTRFYQGRQDARAERDDARAGAAAARAAAEYARTREDAKAKADAAVALLKERNPNATPAELEAVRRGVMDAIPKGDDKAPSEVRLAQALVNAGVEPDMAAALRRAMSSKEKSPAEIRADIYGKALTANMGNATAAQKATEEAMKYLFPEGAAPAKPAPGGSREATGRAVNGSPYPGQGKDKDIFNDPRAIAIRDDPNLTTEEKRKRLRELGYR